MKNNAIKTGGLIFWMVCLTMSFQSCGPDDPPIEPTPKTDKEVMLDFTSNFNGQLINYSTSTFTTSSMHTITPLRFKLILSNFVLTKMDNTVVNFPNTYGYVSFEENKRSVKLPAFAPGVFKKIEFQLGLDSAINHGDPSQWSAEHPLNTVLNDMHWGWSGGYKFVTHEGNFLKDGLNDVYTYHIATLPFATSISIDIQGNLNHTQDNAGTINIKCDLNHFFDGDNAFSIKTEGSSSHSAPAQASLINKLRANIKGMFSASAS